MSWAVVEKAIQAELKKLLGINIECKASADSWDYWSVVFKNGRLTVEQLKVLFKAFDLSERDKQRSMPEKGTEDTNTVDVTLAEKLLQKHLGYTWEQSLADSALWLIGVDYDSFIIGGIRIESTELPTKDELLDILREKGANEKTLREGNIQGKKKNRRFNYWNIPCNIYGGYRSGIFVLVREGVLFLPCNGYDKSYGEHYCLEDYLSLSASDVDRFIQAWWLFSGDLMDAMYELKHYLKSKNNRSKEQ